MIATKPLNYRRLILLPSAAMLVVTATSAMADSIVAPESRSVSAQAVRSIFRVRHAANTMLLAEAVAAPAPPLWTLQLGATYTDSGNDSRAVTTPAELRVDLNGGATSVLLDGDIHDEVHADGTTIRGHGDPSLTVLQKFDIDRGNAVIFGGGVAVPTGSPVGSSSASQSVLAIYNHQFAADGFAQNSFLKDGYIQLWGIVDHDNGDFPAGVSSTAWTGKVYYYQNLATDTDAFLVVARDYRKGGGAVSTIGIGADFPLSEREWGPFSKITGTLTGTCGVSTGQHCGTVEFDVQLPFR